MYLGIVGQFLSGATERRDGYVEHSKIMEKFKMRFCAELRSVNSFFTQLFSVIFDALVVGALYNKPKGVKVMAILSNPKALLPLAMKADLLTPAEASLTRARMHDGFSMHHGLEWYRESLLLWGRGAKDAVDILAKVRVAHPNPGFRGGGDFIIHQGLSPASADALPNGTVFSTLVDMVRMLEHGHAHLWECEVEERLEAFDTPPRQLMAELLDGYEKGYLDIHELLVDRYALVTPLLTLTLTLTLKHIDKCITLLEVHRLIHTFLS